MAIRISQTSKLNARSWSLEARTTCPGSIGADGELVDACQGCYAAPGGGYYVLEHVRAPRLENQEDWKRPEWVDDMVAELDRDRYFRWFDSGDVYDIRLAKKILDVMTRTPWVKHWLPTRMHKFPKFREVLEAMESLPNVRVRYSSDSIRGEYTNEHGSVIYGKDQEPPKGTFACMAYTQRGNCGVCRACWDKGVKTVAYPQHGSLMKSVNRKVIMLKVAN
ncbi:MAG: hypothetical protein AB1522_16855 [Chloroflexota bacterium]